MSRTRRKPRQSITHYAAPAAFLAGVTIAVLLVHSGLSHHHHSTTATTAVVSTTGESTTTTKGSAKTPKRFYTVQTGDTFGTIAAKEGISVAQLQALNPGVSSNALQVGQKLRVK
jgi:LysM repeat protein